MAGRPFKEFTPRELIAELDFRANQAEEYTPTPEAGTIGEHVGFALALVSDVCDITAEALTRVFPEDDAEGDRRDALVRYIERLERDNQLLRELVAE